MLSIKFDTLLEQDAEDIRFRFRLSIKNYSRKVKEIVPICDLMGPYMGRPLLRRTEKRSRLGLFMPTYAYILTNFLSLILMCRLVSIWIFELMARRFRYLLCLSLVLLYW